LISSVLLLLTSDVVHRVVSGPEIATIEKLI